MTGRSLLNEIFKAFLLLGEQWFDLTEKTILFKSLVSGIIIIIFITSLLILIKINRGVGFVILSIFLFSFALTMSHPIPDNEGYFHINYACLFIAFSAFIIYLVSIIKLLPLSRKIAITVILIAFNLALYLTNLPYCDRRDYPYAEVYGRFIISHLAPDSMILTNGDDDIFSLWFQKYVENNRRDVTVFGANFLASEWYENYFEEELKSGKVKLKFADRMFFAEMDYLNFLLREIIEPNYDNLRIYSTYIEPNLNRFNKYEYIFGGTVDLGKQNPYNQFIAKYTMPIGAVWRIKKIEEKFPFFVDMPD